MTPERAVVPGHGEHDHGGWVRRLARMMATLVYRDIDVHLPDAPLPTGPIVAVANHFGGLSDGVLLVDCLPRMPRIVARDAIWRVPGLRQMATGARMIPVHRAADGGPTSNDAMFGTAYEALRSGDLLLIFPEGVTQDAPHLAPVRTGAARILLGAAASGVAGIHVLPIGIHYEDKSGFRSRALVNVGDPIDLDSWIAHRTDPTDGADDRAAVSALTGAIDQALRRAAPDFPDWPTARALETAADVVLHDVGETSAPAIRYGDRALLAGRFNRVAEPARTHLVAAAARYRSALARLRTGDRAVAVAMGTARPRSRWWLLDLALVLLLLPFALAGLAVALGPLLLTVVTSRLPLAPAMRATLVPGVALLSFAFEWVTLSWLALRNAGWEYGMAAMALFWFVVAALFLVAEHVVLLRSRWRSRRPARAEELATLSSLRGELSEQAWVVL